MLDLFSAWTRYSKKRVAIIVMCYKDVCVFRSFVCVHNPWPK